MKIDDEMYDEIFNEDKDGTIDENGIQTIELNRSGVTATFWIG